jgi:CheY-like chemotaxis protein
VTLRILAIDDDPALTDFYRDFLSEEGHEIRTAGHGGEALSVLQEWMPDLILLDLEMPVMSGEAFLKRLDEGPYAAAQVVVVSGSVSRLRAISDRPGTAILRKPFVFEDLGDLVRGADSDGERTKH